MKSRLFFQILSIAVLFTIHFQPLNAAIYPVVISEVFYDSPLEEDISVHSTHHNGEFIELFNPTVEDIRLDNWKIMDKKTCYTFPLNTIIPGRGLLVVAYQFPNSGFKLGDLFPAINQMDTKYVQKSILYQSNIMLNNSSEVVSLYDKNNRLIDQMSYNHTSTFNSYNGNWDICAHNGSYKNKKITNLFSLQRNNIHYSSTSVTPLATDFSKSIATPLDYLTEDYNYPTLTTLYDYNEINNNSNFDVGTLPGTASVTPTGASTYQIPIEVPPGTNGFQPNISIVYNSQGGFGMLAQGWDLSGLSTISRGTQNLYYDGVNGKVQSTNIQFDNQDRLSLDGQRLILLNNVENFAVGAEYGTEVENYSRVKIQNSNETGQIYFVLTTKEGQTVEYGRTTSSIVTNANNSTDNRILAWRINKVIDVNGNSITYEYSSNGQYVSKISYINNSIEFAYQTNSLNPQQHYIGTFLTKQDKLLKSISTKQNSSLVKTYDFNYLTSDMDMRLDNVSLTASDGKKINPTKIKWGEESKIQEVTLEKMPDGNLNNVNNGYLYTGDIDGDGLQDKITMWTGSYSTNEQGWIIATLTGKKSLPAVSFPATTDSYPKFTQLVIGDINQDGKDEIILVGPFSNINVYGLSSDETKLEIISYAEFPTSAYDWLFSDSYLITPLFVNANNDKFIDLAIVPYIKNMRNEDHYPGKNPYNAVAFYGSSEGFKGTGAAYSIFLNGGNDVLKGVYINPVIGDFNADGKPEQTQFVKFHEQESTNILPGIDVVATTHWILGSKYDELIAYFDSRLLVSYVIDANNDGLSDLLHFNQKFSNSNDCTWSLWTNNNSEYPSKSVINMHTAFAKKGGKYELDYTIPIDYNGDGYTDIIIADETFSGSKEENYSSTLWCFYKNIDGNFKLDYQISNTIPLSKIHPTIADINNDGIQDLLIGDKRGGDNNSHYFHAFTMPGANKLNVVHSISNGLGQIEQFVYKYFSDYNQQDQDLTSPVRNLKSPILVVATYIDALGTKTKYEYSNPKIHTEGKGFLGFETVTATNDVAKTKTISTYEYDKTYYNVNLKHQETFTTTFGGILSSLNIKNLDKPINEKRYISQITKQTSIDYTKNITQNTNYLLKFRTSF